MSKKSIINVTCSSMNLCYGGEGLGVNYQLAFLLKMKLKRELGNCFLKMSELAKVNNLITLHMPNQRVVQW